MAHTLLDQTNLRPEVGSVDIYDSLPNDCKKSDPISDSIPESDSSWFTEYKGRILITEKNEITLDGLHYLLAYDFRKTPEENIDIMPPSLENNRIFIAIKSACSSETTNGNGASQPDRITQEDHICRTISTSVLSVIKTKLFMFKKMTSRYDPIKGEIISTAPIYNRLYMLIHASENGSGFDKIKNFVDIIIQNRERFFYQN